MIHRLACLLLVAAVLAAGCDDDDDDSSLPTLTCDDSGCDPACTALLQYPPDPLRSTCSPPGPICDFNLGGQSWEYDCGSNLHITCAGQCPNVDFGVSD